MEMDPLAHRRKSFMELREIYFWTATHFLKNLLTSPHLVSSRTEGSGNLLIKSKTTLHGSCPHEPN